MAGVGKAALMHAQGQAFKLKLQVHHHRFCLPHGPAGKPFRASMFQKRYITAEQSCESVFFLLGYLCCHWMESNLAASFDD